MTPFAIKCGSCGARLRVRKRSTLGQTVTCPKCKNPIKVNPPADWVDQDALSEKPAEGNDAAATPNSSQRGPAKQTGVDVGSLAASFEDVDSLLADVEQASPEQLADIGVSSPAAAKSATSHPQSQTTRPETGPAALPNDDWVSASTKGRRQLLTVISLAIAGIILSGLLIVYLIFQMGRSATEVSQQDIDQNQPSSVDSAEKTPIADKPSGKSPESDPNEAKEPAANPGDVNRDQAAADERNGARSEPGEAADQTTQPGEPQHVTPTDGQKPVAEPTRDDETKTDNGDDKSVSPNAGDAQPPGFNPSTERPRGGTLDDPILAGLEDLDDFTGDTGAGEAREALDAQRRNDEWMLADADAPFIEPPRPRDIDLQRQLEAPLIGLRSDKIPLYRYLELTSTLIGAPISLAPSALRMEGIDHSTELVVNAVEMSFADALSEQLKPLGLTYDVLPNSIRVRPIAESSELVEVTYDVEPLLAGFPQGFDDLQRVTESLIEPASWQGDDMAGGPSIARQGGEMVVRQTPDVQRRVQRLLSLLRQVRGLPSEGGAADIDTELTPYSLANAVLAEPASYELYQPRRLGDVVLKMIEDQRVDIVIDWEGLVAEGWTMDTELPLVVPDTTFEQALRRLCGTLGISFRVLGPRQFELLTRRRAASETEFAMFDLSPLMDQGVNIESIANQIQAAFPPRDPRFANRFYFDAPSSYLLARLSQDDQRALHKFILAWQLTAQTRGR